MLRWEKGNNCWLGFDDDCPCYFVKEEAEGWYWEDSWGFGDGYYDTDEEAKKRANADAETHEPTCDGWTPEELADIMACMEAHERMEIAKGLF